MSEIGEGLKLAGMGFGGVFAVLAIMSIFIFIFGKIFKEK